MWWKGVWRPMRCNIPRMCPKSCMEAMFRRCLQIQRRVQTLARSVPLGKGRGAPPSLPSAAVGAVGGRRPIAAVGHLGRRLVGQSGRSVAAAAAVRRRLGSRGGRPLRRATATAPGVRGRAGDARRARARAGRARGDAGGRGVPGADGRQIGADSGRSGQTGAGSCRRGVGFARRRRVTPCRRGTLRAWASGKLYGRSASLPRPDGIDPTPSLPKPT